MSTTTNLSTNKRNSNPFDASLEVDDQGPIITKSTRQLRSNTEVQPHNYHTKQRNTPPPIRMKFSREDGPLMDHISDKYFHP